MRVDERNAGDITIMKVHGDIVLNGSGSPLADRVRAALDSGRRHIVLDLANVRYVDSTGVGELVAALTAATNRGGTVKLAGLTRRLNDLLVITRLLNVFECFDTTEEAIAPSRGGREQPRTA